MSCSSPICTMCHFKASSSHFGIMYEEPKDDILFIVRLQGERFTIEKNDILSVQVRKVRIRKQEWQGLIYDNHPRNSINGKLRNKHMKYRVYFLRPILKMLGLIFFLFKGLRKFQWSNKNTFILLKYNLVKNNK